MNTRATDSGLRRAGPLGPTDRVVVQGAIDTDPCCDAATRRLDRDLRFDCARRPARRHRGSHFRGRP